jgi:hypothetical protein
MAVQHPTIRSNSHFRRSHDMSYQHFSSSAADSTRLLRNGRAPLRLLVTFALMSTLTACATTGATLGSGVGDAMLDRAPWIAGKPVPRDGATLGVMPIAWQAGATQPAMFEPTAAGDSPLALLMRDMQGYLDAKSLGPRLAAASGSGVVAPDVMFGCVMRTGIDDCDRSEDNPALGRRNTRMRLAVGRPSAPFVTSMQQSMTAAGAERTLLLTLEIGQYVVRQEGLRGKKVVELGRDHSADLPWLTSLETPVQVVQITGVVLDRDGKAIRIAAEGLLPKRTPLLASAVGVQALVSDEDLRTLRTARRDDLTGQPLIWQAGIDAVLRSLGVR